MDTKHPSPIHHLVRSLCDDALFVIASAQRFDIAQIGEVVDRRSPHHESLLRSTESDASSWEEWAVAMCEAIAPIAPPPWLPMHEVIESLTLQAGARGVRSLFTSKPSEKQVQRTRIVGATALRYLTAAMAAGAPLDDEEQLLRRCLANSFGFEAGVVAEMLAEPPRELEPIDPAAELDLKLGRAMARGIWQAGMRDGLDPAEEATIVQACVRLGLGPEGIETARKEARARVDSRGSFGVASVDAIRHVLADDPDNARRLGTAAARLGLAPVYRAETMAAIEHSAPVVLGRRHTLEKDARHACLALAWFGALGTDPPVSRMGELALRHDGLAADLNAKGDGPGLRAQVFGFVQQRLCDAAEKLGH